MPERDEDDPVEDTPRSRLTVALAIAAMVAVAGLLVAGVVLAPHGESGDVDEASLVTVDDAPHAQGVPGAASPRPSATVHEADHAHDADVATAAAPTTATTAAHAHDATATSAGETAVHEHEVTVTVPTAPGAPVTTTTGHDHHVSTPSPTVAPSSPVTTVPAGAIVSLDDPRLTAAQQEAARTLLDTTRAAMASFPDEAAIVAAGYQSIGDAVTGFEHYVHAEYLVDGIDLDPARIESIVLRVADGVKTVVSAMYVLGPAATMADVPEIAGELTTWHDHQNLCWDGLRVVAVTRGDGTCPRGEFRATPPMLHVWLTDQTCGLFSGIEGIHGRGCGAHAH